MGGVWSRIEGRVLVGVSNSDSDFNGAGKTGGEKVHTLTSSEMPSHNHGLNGETESGCTTGLKDLEGTHYAFTLEWNYRSSRTDLNMITGSRGSGQAHNNMPPYYTCYIWRRTA